MLDKKVFLKIDIEGAGYDAFEDILKHSKNITGIVLEIHFCDYYNSLYKAINLLSNLNKDFVLVHVHGNNYAPRFMVNNLKGMLTCAIELSYINKSLVTEYHIASNQSRPLPLNAPCCKGDYCSFKDDIKFEILPQAR